MEPDSSSDEMEESDNLEQAELATEPADFMSHDPVEKAAQEEDKKLMHSFIDHAAANSGLSILLALACSQKVWINTLSVYLEKSELDMVVLGQSRAFSKDTETYTGEDSTHRRNYIAFMFKGRRICRKTFVFAYTQLKKVS